MIIDREGYDIHTNANISISQAILGGIIRVQVNTSLLILKAALVLLVHRFALMQNIVVKENILGNQMKRL